MGKLVIPSIVASGSGSSSANVFTYKGSVATYNDLPSLDNKVGDVYNVLDTGKNFAWDGITWDDLGGDSFGSGIDLLQFLQSTTPTTFSEGNKWLNTSNYKLYIAESNSSWDSGTTITEDQVFSFGNLLYHYNGSSLEVYSTVSITEQRDNTEIKFWYGTQNQYDAISNPDSNTNYIIIDDSSINSTLLATQQEFNNGAQNKAATPYQVLNAGFVSSTDITNIVKITQADYDTLVTKDPNTFYVIVAS